jgi:hypothetical protein
VWTAGVVPESIIRFGPPHGKRLCVRNADQMKIKLNGWQRLWVVTSVLWFLGISILNYNMNYKSHKTDAEIYHTWSNEIRGYLGDVVA